MTSLESSGLNAWYVEQLLEQYRDNPEAVDPAWREVFERDGDISAAPTSEPVREAAPSGNGGATVEQVVEAPGTPPPAVAAIVEPPKPESVAPRQAPDGELMVPSPPRCRWSRRTGCTVT